MGYGGGGVHVCLYLLRAYGLIPDILPLLLISFYSD